MGPDDPLVADTSILRRLPSNLNERDVVILDAVRYSLEMVDIAHRRLLQAALGASAREVDSYNRVGAALLIDAWSIVDSINRLVLLLGCLRKAKRHPTVQILTRAAETATQLRNGAQHLDNEINTLVQSQRPAWGSLSWLFMPEAAPRGTIVIFVSGTIRTMEQPLVNPIGKNIRFPIDLITLTAHGASLCLSDVMRTLPSVVQTLEQSIERAAPDDSRSGSESFLFVDISFDGEPEEEQKEEP